MPFLSVSCLHLSLPECVSSVFCYFVFSLNLPFLSAFSLDLALIQCVYAESCLSETCSLWILPCYSVFSLDPSDPWRMCVLCKKSLPSSISCHINLPFVTFLFFQSFNAPKTLIELSWLVFFQYDVARQRDTTMHIFNIFTLCTHWVIIIHRTFCTFFSEPFLKPNSSTVQS